MFSKRKYLFEVVKKKAQSMRGSVVSWEDRLILAANDLDHTCGKTGLTKYYQQLKAADPSKILRKDPCNNTTSLRH
jgi:hypothetical protein